MTHRLEADSIRLEIGGRKILSDIYLKCETGRITGLLGRNGSGKSCLMKVIYGSIECSQSVRFDGKYQSEAFKRPDLLLYLPQFNFIPAGLTIKRVFSDFGLDYSLFEKKFPEFSSKYRSKMKDLSGGGRRLVEIYVIVKSKSQFAMLDEPFTHMNPIQVEKVKEFFLEEKNNKGLLLTDHMYKHILEISDDLTLLVNGKIHSIKCFEEIEFLGYAKI